MSKSNAAHKLDWDAVARAYVERDVVPEAPTLSAEDRELAAETFGPLHHYGIHEPVVVGDNDNAAALQPTREPGSHYRNPKALGFYDWPVDRGPYISTYRGRFYPFSPRASEVDILDIAHSLAAMPRYTGHGQKHYSVAEHSVHIARYLLPKHGARVALAGLLHDAPEALSGFGDVARPAKQRAPIVKETEDRIWWAVAAAFCLSPIMPDEVHEADSRIIADEMAANMHEVDPNYTDPLGVTLEFWPAPTAEIYFLDMYRKLVAEVAK